jgi:hypothetical protein
VLAWCLAQEPGTQDLPDPAKRLASILADIYRDPASVPELKSVRELRGAVGNPTLPATASTPALPADVLDTFDARYPVAIIDSLPSAATLLRLYGGASGADGRWLSYFAGPRSPVVVPDTLAHVPQWAVAEAQDATGFALPLSNDQTHAALVHVPQGERLVIGVAKAQLFGHAGAEVPGGGVQVYAGEARRIVEQKFQRLTPPPAERKTPVDGASVETPAPPLDLKLDMPTPDGKVQREVHRFWPSLSYWLERLHTSSGRDGPPAVARRAQQRASLG